MDGRLSTASLTPEEARARTSAAWRKESSGSGADSEAKGVVQKLDTEFNTLLQKTDQTADELRSRSHVRKPRAKTSTTTMEGCVTKTTANAR